jgi:hypothetical protein
VAHAPFVPGRTEVGLRPHSSAMDSTLRRLDSIHSRLVDTITPIDEASFTQNPSEKEWSIAEILHHLYLVEARVIEELEAALANPPRKVALLRRLMPTFIVASRLLRVKSPRSVIPLNPPARAEVIANYEAVRTKLKKLCSVHGRSRLKQTVFKHPVLGEIDGAATVSFIGYHELRHYKQVREVIKKLDQSRR